MKKIFNLQRDNKIILKEKGKTTLIQTDKITHLTCRGSLTTVHTADNNNYIITKLLKQYETELSKFGFIRANNSTIVNMIHVCEIRCSTKRKIILANDVEVNISRRRMYLFREFLEKQEVV